MRIGGLQKFSLIDYPGKMAAVIFTQGCNLRCPYCHNAELVDPQRYCPVISEGEVFHHLKRRQDQLQGVVVSGGEPTIHRDLPLFIERIRQMGYVIKLDTNGTNPMMLRQLLDDKLIDFVAMDVKNSFDRYHIAVGGHVNVEVIKESVDLIQQSGIDHLFRTTVRDDITTEDDLCEIRSLVGDSPYTTQAYQPRDKELTPFLKH